jgi:hypothetical protein
MVLGAVGWVAYSGWSPTPYNEVRNIPKSVRDNPGSYRSFYSGPSRYIGGK